MSSRSRDAKSGAQSAAEGPLSLRDITPKSRREADKEREDAERLGFHPHRRWRRKIGRPCLSTDGQNRCCRGQNPFHAILPATEMQVD